LYYDRAYNKENGKSKEGTLMFNWLRTIFEEIDYQLDQRQKDKLEEMKLRDVIETQKTSLTIQQLSTKASMYNVKADIKQIKLGGTSNGLVK